MKYIESVARTTEGGTEIFGVAAVSMFSRNDNVYFPAELARNDGKIVPLNWMHEDPVRKIGEVTLTFNQEKRRLMYQGTITDPEIADLVKNRELFVSIGADSADQKEVCDTAQCYNAPIGLDIFELSIVDVPGIPEVTLNVLRESFKESFTSLVHENFQKNQMSTNSEKTNPQDKEVSEDTTTTVTKTVQTDPKPESDQQTQPQKQEQECPPGQRWDGEKCVPIEKSESEQSEDCGCGKKHQPEANTPNIDQKSEETKVPEVKLDTSAFENSLQKGLKDLTDQIGALVKQPKEEAQIARISTTKDGSFATEDINTIANKGLRALESYGYFSYNVDAGVTPFTNSRGSVQEAVSYASGQSGISADGGIKVLPGRS